MIGGNFGKLATVLSHLSHGFQALARFRPPSALISGALFMMATMVVLLAWAPQASAYSAYTPAKGGQGNCASCHGDFNNNAGYVSLQDADPATWPTDTMNSHAGDMLQGTCAACHGSGAKYPVLLSSSNDPVLNLSCAGCHGRAEDANTLPGNVTGTPTGGNGWGAGLRQAHFRANRDVISLDDGVTVLNTTLCFDCHGDANPTNFTTAAEDTMPVYYSNATIGVTPPTNPCNIPIGTESLYGSLGLDNDGNGFIDSNDTACSSNNPPVANAGTDQSVLVLSTVTLDGSLSSDPDSNPLTYAWTFNSVPAGSGLTVLTNPTTVNPTFVPDVPGTYDVQLVVNDGLVDSAPDTVLITTQNSAPVANAGPNQSQPNGATVTLDGSASSDVDGDPLTYSWTLTAQPASSTATLSGATTANPTFVIDISGTYVAELIVNDGTTDSAPDTVQITTSNTAPVANAGPDQSGLWNDVITLDGSGSTDVDGNPLTYSWTLTSQPAGSTATLSNPAIVNPTFVIDVSGTYVATLVVNDGSTDSTPDTVQITTDNTAPVAHAGSDQSVAQNDLVTLDGSTSSDVDGDPLTYSWSILSGPDSPTLNNPTTANPTFTASGIGTYTVQLIVNDGTVDSAPDTVQIGTTGNTAPVANAGPDQSGFWNDTITLDGSASSDVDSDPLTYSWSFASRPAGSTAALANPTTVNPSFIIDVSGTYTVQLIVNDGALDSAPDTMVVTTDNSAPVANAGPDQSVFVNDLVTLDGSASSDVDNNLLTYSWSMSSKPVGSTAVLSSTTAVSPTFTVDLPGTYVAQLIVNDGTVSSAPDTVSVTTLNSTPVANAGVNQTVLVNDTVTLDGSGSSDADFDPLTYSWSLTSKPAGSTAALTGPTTVNPTFVADLSGTYVAQLIVNDGTVSSAPDSVTISTGNTPPVADAGPDQATAGGTVTLDGSGSYDADLDPLTYNWAFTARPLGSTATLTGATTVNPTFPADLTGTYTVRLIVNDGTVNSIQDTVNIVNTLPGGLEPNIVLAPTTYDFGSVLLGTSQTKNVAIQNNGTAFLTVTGLTMSGADFAYSGPAVPFGVSVGYQVNLQVTYTPGAAGASAPGSLTVTSDDPDTSTTAFTFNGSGYVGLPAINLPASIAFGDVAVATTKTATATIKNQGESNLDIANLAVTGSADFALPAGTPTSYVVEPGRQVSIPVNYTPGQAGADAGTLAFTSNDAGSPHSVSLAGNGVTAIGTPDINQTPSIAFGDVLSGSWKREYVAIQNLGTANLEVTSLALTGSADFAFFNAPTAPFTIKPGRQVSFRVQYTASAGPASGSVDIGSDDPVTPSVSVSLSGNGIGGAQAISAPASVDYGDVTVGQSLRKFVAIQNTGTADLTVNSLTLSGSADFALVNEPTGAFVIKPGRQATLKVDYSPSATGLATGALAIANDSGTPNLSVGLNGNGTGGSPAVTLSALSVVYGDVEVGKTKTASVAIQNTGTGNLQVTGLLATGSADFALPAGAPTSYLIEPGRQVTVQVNYTPGEVGADSGALAFTTDDTGNPNPSISLDGNGVAAVGLPVVNLPVLSVDYGNVLVGTTKSVYVAIQNTGTTDLNVTGLGLTGSTDFTLPTGTPASYVIAPGRQASIRVNYTPGQAGADAGTLAFTTDDTGNPNPSVSLAGNGEAGVANIVMPVTTYDFGDVVVGTSKSVYIAIQNNGTGDLNVTNVTLAGSAFFTLPAGTPTSYVIAPGRQVTVKVIYAPTGEGIVGGTLTVDSDDGDQPSIPVTLSGNGVPAV